MVQTRIQNPSHAKAALAALLLSSAFLTAACSKAPSGDAIADLQTRLSAAEARATAAERRAKSAEDAAGVKYQQTVAATAPSTPDNGQAGEGQFGQPMIDTAPIDTQPQAAAPPELAPSAMTN